MQPLDIRNASKYAALTALLLAAGSAAAVESPRVMFVSNTDVKPVIIDLQGREIPAKKGVVIEPGFTVKVPEGATLQIMTPEKGILALRPNSLLKFEGLADGPRPYKIKLDSGGLRVANSDKNPRKYEVDTPNAKIRFEKGDNEAFYLQNGKLKDGRWGTFVRGLKDDDVVLSTPTGDVKVPRSDIGFVAGTGGDKPVLVARADVTGKGLANPVSYVPGAKEIGTTEMVQNFQALGDSKVGTAIDTTSRGAVGGLTRSDPVVTLPVIKDPTLATKLTLPDVGASRATTPALTTPVLAAAALGPVADIGSPKAIQAPPVIQPTIVLTKDVSGNLAPLSVNKTGDVSALSTKIGETKLVPKSEVPPTILKSRATK